MKLKLAQGYQNYVPFVIITAHSFTPLSAPQSKLRPAESQYIYIYIYIYIYMV